MGRSRRSPVSAFFFSSRRRHTRLQGDWSSDVCSSDLPRAVLALADALDKDDSATIRRVSALALEKMVNAQTADDALALARTALEKAATKIGRASCRERV